MRIVAGSLLFLSLLLVACWGIDGPKKAEKAKEAASDGSDGAASGGLVPQESGSETASDAGSGTEAGESDGGNAPATGGGDEPVPEPEIVTAAQVEAAAKAHIEATLAENGGVIKMFDDRTSEDLELEFVELAATINKVEGRGYLVEGSFKPKGGEAGQVYGLHFWLNFRTDKDDGAEATALDVTDTRIFRASAKEGGKWVTSTRYDMSKEKMTPLK